MEPWTEERIAERLGISTAVYQKERLSARHIAAIRRAGIGRVELLLKRPSFDFRDRGQTAEIVGECRQQDLSIESVHGSFSSG